MEGGHNGYTGPQNTDLFPKNTTWSTCSSHLHQEQKTNGPFVGLCMDYETPDEINPKKSTQPNTHDELVALLQTEPRAPRGKHYTN